MLGPPADVPSLWVALTVAGAAALALASGLTATPPAAGPAAATIDRVAGDPYTARGSHALHATAVKVTAHRLSLRGPGGTAGAALRFGPVVPVGSNERLRRVVRGAAPPAVFRSADAFRTAVNRAKRARHGWRDATGSLRVAHVTYGGYDVTLVAV